MVAPVQAHGKSRHCEPAYCARFPHPVLQEPKKPRWSAALVLKGHCILCKSPFRLREGGSVYTEQTAEFGFCPICVGHIVGSNIAGRVAALPRMYHDHKLTYQKQHREILGVCAHWAVQCRMCHADVEAQIDAREPLRNSSYLCQACALNLADDEAAESEGL